MSPAESNDMDTSIHRKLDSLYVGNNQSCEDLGKFFRNNSFLFEQGSFIRH